MTKIKSNKIFSIKLILLILSVALVLLLSACAKTSAPNQAQTQTLEPTKQISFIDDAKKQITLDALPEKIVVLNPADVEIFYALGAQDKIIAIGEYCNFPAETSEKPKLSTGAKTNLEEILALDPDCIILGTMAQKVSDYDTLNASGATAIINNATNIANTYENIERIGLISGKTEQATKLINTMKSGFLALQEKVKQVEQKTAYKKTAYIEISPLQYGLWTSGADTFQNEILSLAGLDNIFFDTNSWSEISQEQVIERNPDVIITTASIVDGAPNPIDEIKLRKGWENISAVKDNNVFVVDPDMTSRGGPRLVEAANHIFDNINKHQILDNINK